jgi:U3 small nucleolar RNA-associated protein 21
MQTLNASAADFAIRTLSPFDDCLEMSYFLEMLLYGMQTGKSFDALEVYLNIFLKIHSDLIIGSERLSTLVQELEQCQQKAWRQIEELLQNALCLVDFGRNT